MDKTAPASDEPQKKIAGNTFPASVTTAWPWAASVFMGAMLLFGWSARQKIEMSRKQAQQANKLLRELRPLEAEWNNYSMVGDRILSHADQDESKRISFTGALPPPARTATNKTDISSQLSLSSITMTWDEIRLRSLCEALDAFGPHQPQTRLASLRIDPGRSPGLGRVTLQLETISPRE